MFRVQKNNWQPNAPLENLKARAALMAKIRDFFAKRNVLEVETPLMCRSAATDPYLKPIPVDYQGPDPTSPRSFFLQTSPEYPMKRLLAAGSGPIYQICKVFRDDEVGRLHNPEFTMLEWYQPGFDHHDLMDEMDALLCFILGSGKALRFSYADLFKKMLDIDPHHASKQQLENCAALHQINLSQNVAESLSTDDWLDLLMTHCIEPSLGFERPAMIYDYPVSKAALAKIRHEDPSVAERFEVYVQGIELANGYHELTDPKAQRSRFEQDCEFRKKFKFASIPIDEYLIEAMEAGFPDSAGVALGIDRLFMLKLQSTHIEEVLSFTIDRA
jgi:lysyl-tRNA synthetase class 2